MKLHLYTRSKNSTCTGSTPMGTFSLSGDKVKTAEVVKITESTDESGDTNFTAETSDGILVTEDLHVYACVEFNDPNPTIFTAHVFVEGEHSTYQLGVDEHTGSHWSDPCPADWPLEPDVWGKIIPPELCK